MDCLFCAIIDGSIPSRKVYADDFAYAFLDINPWHAGHTLVVPRRHVADVLTEPQALSEIGDAITATGKLLVDRLGADGLNVLLNAGEVAGQEVFHLHAHLIALCRAARNGGTDGTRPADRHRRRPPTHHRRLAVYFLVVFTVLLVNENKVSFRPNFDLKLPPLTVTEPAEPVILTELTRPAPL